MNLPDVTALVVTYAKHRGGQFTRAEFIRWGVGHGLARRAPESLVDGAIASAIHQKLIFQTESLPGKVHPTYQLRGDARRKEADPNHLTPEAVAAYLLASPRTLITDGTL